MTEDTEDMWQDCNCMNCRLARIEDSIQRIIHFIDKRPPEQRPPEPSRDPLDMKLHG